MRNLILFMMVMAVVLFACTDDLSNPVFDPAAQSAAKAIAEGTCALIQWDCDPSMWLAPEDSVFTVFYDSLRFQTRGPEVHVEYYLSSNRKLVYLAHETESPYRRYKAAFRFTDSKCGLWSNALDDVTLAARIYKGDVKLVYRDLPAHKQYQIVEGEERWKIASIKPDGTVVSVDDRHLPINQDDHGNLLSPFSEIACAEEKGSPEPPLLFVCADHVVCLCCPGRDRRRSCGGDRRGPDLSVRLRRG